MKLYIADRSYPSNAFDKFKTLPFNDFGKIHDYQPMGSSGSGTIIHVENGEALVVTCKHVVSRPSSITVSYYNKFSVKGEYLAHDQYADLAFVVIKADSTTPFVPVAKSRVTVGTPIHQAGYPGGQGPVKRFAKVFGYTGRQANGNYDLRISFASRPGDSGSGVFNPAEKGLCGVVWGGDGREAIAVEQYDIKRFYETCLPIFRRRPRNPGVPPSQPPGTPVQPPVGPPGSEPPVSPPAAPETKPGALEAALKKLKEIEEALALKGDGKVVEDIKGGLEKAKAVLGLLENGLTDLRNSGLISEDKHAALQKKLDAFQGVVNGVDGKVDSKLLEKLGPFVGIAKDALATAIEAKSGSGAAIEAASGLSKWLPWLIPVGAAGPLGLGLSLLALYRRAGKAAGASGMVVTDDVFAKLLGMIRGRHEVPAVAQTPVVVSQMPQPVQNQAIRPDPIMVPTAPIVPQVRTEHSFIRVPDTTGEEALRKALKLASENGIVNPGSLGAIENLARQILSGNSTKEGV